MRNSFCVLLSVVLTIAKGYSSVYTSDVWHALSHGADIDVQFRIVDDAGMPVADASCSGWLYQEGDKNHGCGYRGVSDSNGCFRVKGRCGEWFTFIARKDGYYRTMIETKNPTGLADPAVSDGKWQPYGEMRTVVLKRIKDPYAAKVYGGKLCSSVIPAFGEWLPFDMELSDWLPPHGRGVHSDVLLRFEKQIGEKWYEFSYSMEASFTNNPCAGVYCKTLDAYSDLKTDYVADTNANYSASYRYSIESGGGKPVKINGCPNDSYLVFRTRTKLDANGKLVSAHYGKYCSVWRSDKDRMHHGEGCFNPKANDPNIEGEQRLHYAIKNYRKAK